MAIPAQPHADPAKRGGMYANRLAFALHTPGFPVLWGATLCSQVGGGMQQVLLGWAVLSMTDSSSTVGMLFAMRSLPNVLVGFAAGALTDRLDRRTLMRVTSCGMALVSWLIAWLLWMGADGTLAVTALRRVSSASSRPSRPLHGRCTRAMSWASAVLYKVLPSSPSPSVLAVCWDLYSPVRRCNGGGPALPFW